MYASMCRWLGQVQIGIVCDETWLGWGAFEGSVVGEGEGSMTRV